MWCRETSRHNLPMKHSDFCIGGTFFCGERVWRCTDIGTRTILAIRTDSVEVQTSSGDPNEAPTLRTLSGSEAESEGLFKGPPYMIAESVFDEYDIQGCWLQLEDASKSDPLLDLTDASELKDKQREQAIQGPFGETLKILRARREVTRAAKEAEIAKAGESEALARMRADARPKVLMNVVKCGAGHLMRAKDYDTHRSSCGRKRVLPVTEQDVLDLELREANEHV